MSENKVFKGTTSSGFSYTIKAEDMDNMELFEELAEYSETNPLPIIKICLYLLGKEQKGAFYEHLRKIDGRVSFARANAEIEEMFHQIGDAGKNS